MTDAIGRLAESERGYGVVLIGEGGKTQKGTAAAAAAAFPFYRRSRSSLSLLSSFWGGAFSTPLAVIVPFLRARSESEFVPLIVGDRGLLSQKTSRNNAIRKEKAPSIPHMYKL